MKGRLRSFLVYTLTAVFSFFLGLFILDQVILPQITGGKEEVEVPKLEGMSLDEGRSLCRGQGLELIVQGETYHASVPASHIMKQDPEAGAMVKRGRQVYVLSSLGPETVTVPPVGGLTLRQAQILIERGMLKVAAVHRRPDSRVARDRVIEVQPAEGSPLPWGGAVELTVSDGVEQLRVPSLIDKPLQEAESTLNAAGLRLGRVSYQQNSFIPAGRVLDQAPLERAIVNSGAAVDVVVSGTAP
ncbi:PASTA domain-containing protein [bacterium]|nr:PASTA domain-containing protein [bacterium]